jgi:Ca2+-binding EF-hand superfamily protein
MVATGQNPTPEEIEVSLIFLQQTFPTSV